jgi:hypothetical protein
LVENLFGPEISKAEAKRRAEEERDVVPWLRRLSLVLTRRAERPRCARACRTPRWRSDCAWRSPA